MEYARLGFTGIKVSRICLGTAFRSEGDEQTCVAVIKRAAELGCNFVDCANVYRDGLSEQIVGKAISACRDKFIVATKVGAPTTEGINGGGLSRKAILRDVEASLRRLGTDYIDLYLCHFPDPDTPLEETVRTMDDLVRQGKIRYPGCCNFPAWQLSEAISISDRHCFAAFVCNEVQFGLLDRRIEDELIPFCKHRNVAITAYATTFIGLLSGQHRYGQAPPAGTPWDKGPYNYRAAMTRATDEVIQILIVIAHEAGKTPTQVALAWCLTRPHVTSLIIGVDTLDQVDEDFGWIDWHLSEEMIKRLDAVSEGMRLTICKDAPRGYQRDDPWPQ